MTVRGFSLLGLGIVAAFSLAGCGKPEEDTTLGQGQAGSASDVLSAGIEEGAKEFGPVDAGSAVVGSNACVTLSGDLADTDGDNVPAAATLTYACTSTSLGYTGTLTGTLAVVDDQPSAIAWAFTGTADLEATLTGPAGATLVRNRDGSVIATQETILGPFHLDRALDASTVFTSANGNNTISVTESVDWTLVYTPQLTWQAGSPVITGTLAGNGAWSVTVGTRSADATIASPTPLTLNPTCATRITAGVLTATWEGESKTATLTVTWTGCGATTHTYTES